MKKLYSLLFVILCLFIAGCDDDSDDTAVQSPVVKSDVEYSAAGGTGTIEVISSAIKAVSDKSWCTIVMSNKVITLQVAPNSSLESRNAMITLTEGNTVVNQIPVTQAGNRVPIPDQETVNFDANGATVKIHVTSVMPFTAQTPEDSWITAVVEGDSLVLTAPSYYVRGSRNTTVKLISGELASEIGINQSGLVLTPASTEILMPNEGETIRVNVQSTLEFTATSDKDWLKVTTSKSYINLKAEENTEGALRSATVTLESHGIEATITVTQRNPIYTDFIGKWTLSAKNGGNPVTFNLTIEQKTAGKTYLVYGFGGTSFAQDFPITMYFDESSLVYIRCQNSIGQDKEGNTVGFTGATKDYGVVTGTYIMAIGQLTGNTINWQFQKVDLGQGPEPLVGMGYRYMDTKGGWHTYNADGTLYDLVMTKVSSSTRSANIIPTHFSSGRSFTTLEKAISAR